MLIGLYILDKFDVESYHSIKKLLCHIVWMKEFFKFKQFLNLLILKSDLDSAFILHLLFLTIKSNLILYQYPITISIKALRNSSPFSSMKRYKSVKV